MAKIRYAENFPNSFASVHFIGIGGGGMSGIASLMIAAGVSVSGSDLRDQTSTRALQQLGATVFEGHKAENLDLPELVVVTSAMPADNPEYLRAVELGIPVIHRSQALAWLANRQRLISVAGAHGKSTSTGMTVNALEALGVQPSYVSGAIISDRDNSAGVGSDDLFVVEADESDGSFLRYESDIILITNVDADHLDYFGNQENFEQAFVEFASTASEFIVISADDPGAIRVSKQLTDKKVLSFGFADSATVRVLDYSYGNGTEFSLEYLGQSYRGSIAQPGKHNVLNATGVFTVLVGMGFEPDAAIAALSSYQGTQHRFELMGEVAGIKVYDDYAHHPTEVTATLSMASELVHKPNQVIAIYQPKRYTRTRDFAKEFAGAYERGADFTVILGIYPAMEPEIPGVTGQIVADEFADPTKCAYLPDWSAAAEYVACLARPGDLIISFSSGDKKMIIPDVLSALKSRFS